MPKFRAILSPREIAGVVYEPHRHNPTGVGGVVVSHMQLFEEFVDLDGKLAGKKGERVPATAELCLKIAESIEQKYGAALVTWEEVSEPKLLASRKAEAEKPAAPHAPAKK